MQPTSRRSSVARACEGHADEHPPLHSAVATGDDRAHPGPIRRHEQATAKGPGSTRCLAVPPHPLPSIRPPAG